MAKNHTLIETFLSQSTLRTTAARALRRAGLDVTHVCEITNVAGSANKSISSRGGRTTIQRVSQLWSLWVKPSSGTASRIGVSREILVIGSEYIDLQMRTLQAAENQIADEERLSDELCLVICADAQTAAKVEEMSHGMRINFVGMSSSEIAHFAQSGSDLVGAIQARFFVKDLYHISVAITNRREFYGREQLLKDVSHSLRHGNGHIGLFGLRKMGKTSVLLRLLESMSAASGVNVAHIDMQRIDAVRKDAGFMLWSMGQQLVERNKKLRHRDDFQMFGRTRLFSEVNLSDAQLFECFSHDIGVTVASMRPHETIVFMIDEIELLMQDAWGDAFVRLWRLLRGVSQVYPGKISFFVSGTSPICVERGKIGALENPAYNFFRPIYLGPLSASEGQSLLCEIGEKIGLQWDNGAVSIVHDLVGGHPLLLRAYGSRVHHVCSPRHGVRNVSETTIRGCVQQVLQDVNSVLMQMVEVLEEEYVDEYTLLDLLAQGQISEFRDFARQFPSEVSHLRGYGLIDDPSSATGLRNRLLHDWIRERGGRKRMARNLPKPEGVAIGDVIEGYTIRARLGQSGGYGDVYLAERVRCATGSDVTERYALKILRRGLISEMNREIDAIQAIRSSGVVKIFDYGKDPRGVVFIVMEHLEGTLLHDFCTPAHCLSAVEGERIMRGLLDTLKSMHPDQEKVQSLSAKTELTAQDMQDLQMARFGVIHRDIKPQNIFIVKGRGPVLIDFGIASRCGDSVRTVSATEGYVPPDGVGVGWGPDVDLYALAITIGQAVTGVPIGGERSRDDLCLAIEGRCKGPFRDVLLREIRGNRSERYTSASEMIHALSGRSL